MKITINIIVALILFLVSLKLFVDHRDKEYNGPYKFYGNYQNISLAKHDITKFTFIVLYIFLITGLAPGQKWWDANDIFNSVIGRIFAVGMAFLTYHELVQPYAVKFLSSW